MKYFTFKRDFNNFDDILKDPPIKKFIKYKIRWSKHLMLGFSDDDESAHGYLVLKYGEELINPINRDFTPVPNVDYVPKRR